MMPDALKKRIVKLIDNKKWARDALRSVEARKYMDSKVFDVERGGCCIRNAIGSGIPQAIGKIGSAELYAIRKYLRYQSHPDVLSATAYDRKTLGLFPNTLESLERYTRLMTEDTLPELTVLAVWFNWGEASIVKKHASQANKCPIFSLESYVLTHERWTSALKGKKVLVISPFVKTIEMQYKKRIGIWRGYSDVLPEFNLQLIKAPYGIDLVPPTHSDWFAVLDDLKRQMTSLDFDIAIIGASVFSLPLAVHAKRLGKHGIHLGGALQIYFGITGNRWNNNPIISKFHNEHWTRPLPEETPSNNAIVENGAYW